MRFSTSPDDVGGHRRIREALTPVEVATGADTRAVLLSDRSSHTTGPQLSPDGGETHPDPAIGR